MQLVSGIVPVFPAGADRRFSFIGKFIVVSFANVSS